MKKILALALIAFIGTANVSANMFCGKDTRNDGEKAMDTVRFNKTTTGKVYNTVISKKALALLVAATTVATSYVYRNELLDGVDNVMPSLLTFLNVMSPAKKAALEAANAWRLGKGLGQLFGYAS